MGSFKLKRTKQCAKCPWKVSTNPYEIPDGYDIEKHKALSCAIAKDTSIKGTGHAMACHHSKDSNMQHCVGWIHNQLGSGNNIPLRLQMMHCENIRDLKIVGEQHENFEDTLPN
jgi:hypothetical protein